MDKFIDDFVESIRPAIAANAQRWPDYDLDWQKQEFKQYIHSKIDWLNTQWGMPVVLDPDGPQGLNR